MSDLAEFSKLAVTLESWRNQIVFVGGWAFRLYRFEPRAFTPDYGAIFTQDADVAYAEREELVGDIEEALVGAGFEPQPNLAGGFDPLAMRYTLGKGPNNFYAEFLTPLNEGASGRRRKKNNRNETEPDATELRAGVVAQKLRHLEVLLHEPWIVDIPADASGLGEIVAGLRIPNPVSFMIQKLLIRNDRVPDKRAQDVLYIYDAMYIFGGVLDEHLVPIWKVLDGTLSDKQRKSVRDGASELFSEVNDTLRAAAGIPKDEREIVPEDMLQLCKNGFEELFGEAL